MRNYGMRHDPRRNPARALPRDNQVLLGITFEWVTQESAERGEAEDGGWEMEMTPMRFRDAVDYIKQWGTYDSAQYMVADELVFHGFQKADHRSGGYVTNDVIVRGDPAVLRRIMSWYESTLNRRHGVR